jgi:hypothetical protein
LAAPPSAPPSLFSFFEDFAGFTVVGNSCWLRIRWIASSLLDASIVPRCCFPAAFKASY